MCERGDVPPDVSCTAEQRWAWTGSGSDILQDDCNFLDQDWIWIFIFEKKMDQDICLISITKFSWEWFKMLQTMMLLFSLLLWFLYSQKIKMTLSVCAPLITIDGNSFYFVLNLFQRDGSSKLLSYWWYERCFVLLCWVKWHMCCVCCEGKYSYFMGGQLFFDWDWLESFFITRNRPVGNIVTNTKCQRVSHVQMQCTIASISDAQVEGKVSVTPKSWLPHISIKTYYNTFAASAELAQKRIQGRRLGWSPPHPFKTYESNFIRHDFAQFGK